MKLYTRTGDAGETGLFGGERVPKDHARVRAYGAVDAANAVLGWCRAGLDPDDGLGRELEAIMSDLFDVGAELATPPSKEKSLHERLTSMIDPVRIAHLESLIDAAEDELPPLATFVLPTGVEVAARLHVGRTKVREAERDVVSLIGAGHEVRPEVLGYLNRLSDLLFAWARLCNHRAGVADVPWQSQKARRG